MQQPLPARRGSAGGVRSVLPAVLTAVSLALALGLSASFGMSRSAEAASAPEPVAIDLAVDQDSCSTAVSPFFNYPFHDPAGVFGNFYYPGFQTGLVTQVQTYPCNISQCIQSVYLGVTYIVACPGPPATIELPATASATCASATNIQVKVRDANGLNVLDGTPVSFGVTPFGSINGDVVTTSGEATASLQVPVKTAGTLTLTIASGSVTRTMTIEVTCDAPGTGFSAGGGAPAPAFSAPAMAPSSPSFGSPGY